MLLHIILYGLADMLRRVAGQIHAHGALEQIGPAFHQIVGQRTGIGRSGNRRFQRCSAGELVH